jgi:archaellum biogenesis ATPase FlaH
VRARGRPVVDYVYTDEAGAPLFKVTRFEPKDFRPYRAVNGGFARTSGLGDLRRVLFRLPAIIEAVRVGRPVWIVEGEKDVLALEAQGVVATTAPGGVGQGAKLWREGIGEPLRGAEVVIVADRDTSRQGLAHARRVAVALEGVAAMVAIVLPAEGEDAFDHLMAGRTLEDFEDVDLDELAPLGGEACERIKESGAAWPKLRVLDTLALLTTEPPSLDWLAEGVFCRGKFTLFGGREKRGKSLVQLALAVRMASGGGTIAGITVKAGRVLLVDAENGEREVHRRLRAMDLATEHAADLVIAEARGFELRTDLTQVADLAKRCRADLVLLDSFRALWRGDERDEADVAAALDPVRQLAHDTDVAYALTHHAQKGGEEYRGSSAIGACIEWCVMLEREREDEDKTRRRLVNPLARFAPEREDRWLQIHSGGDDGPVSLAVAQPFVREHEAPVRDEVEAAIAEFIAGCGAAVLSNRDHTPTPPSWSTADLARAVGRDPKNWTVRQAVQRLAERGVIYRDGERRWHPAAPLFGDEEVRAP